MTELSQEILEPEIHEVADIFEEGSPRDDYVSAVVAPPAKCCRDDNVYRCDTKMTAVAAVTTGGYANSSLEQHNYRCVSPYPHPVEQPAETTPAMAPQWDTATVLPTGGKRKFADMEASEAEYKAYRKSIFEMTLAKVSTPPVGRNRVRVEPRLRKTVAYMRILARIEKEFKAEGVAMDPANKLMAMSPPENDLKDLNLDSPPATKPDTTVVGVNMASASQSNGLSQTEQVYGTPSGSTSPDLFAAAGPATGASSSVVDPLSQQLQQQDRQYLDSLLSQDNIPVGNFDQLYEFVSSAASSINQTPQSVYSHTVTSVVVSSSSSTTPCCFGGGSSGDGSGLWGSNVLDTTTTASSWSCETTPTTMTSWMGDSGGAAPVTSWGASSTWNSSSNQSYGTASLSQTSTLSSWSTNGCQASTSWDNSVASSLPHDFNDSVATSSSGTAAWSQTNATTDSMTWTSSETSSTYSFSSTSSSTMTSASDILAELDMIDHDPDLLTSSFLSSNLESLSTEEIINALPSTVSMTTASPAVDSFLNNPSTCADAFANASYANGLDDFDMSMIMVGM